MILMILVEGISWPRWREEGLDLRVLSSLYA